MWILLRHIGALRQDIIQWPMNKNTTSHIKNDINRKPTKHTLVG